MEDWDAEIESGYQPPPLQQLPDIKFTNDFSSMNISDDQSSSGFKQRGRGGGRGRGRGFNRRNEGSRGGFGGGGGGRFGGSRNQDSNSDEMTVPKYCIGKLIGRGGSRKKELEDQSGARLQINEENGEGLVLINGNDDSISKAKELIDNIINDDSRGGSRGGHGGGSNGGRASGFGGGGVSGFGGSGSGFGGGGSGFGGGFSQSNDSGGGFGTVAEGFIMDWGAIHREAEINRLEKWKDCPDLVKEFYIEDPEVTMMSSVEADRIRTENNRISVVDLSDKKRAAPNPCITFEQAFDHYPEILVEIYKQKFVKPSPIQLQMWPIALQGIDCIGIAQTGTGKTLAFLLPALIHIDNQPIPLSKRGGANVLVLSPTRELALQIHQEVMKYNYKGIKSCCVYGGGSRKEQITSVQDGVQIIIATPGRLNDLVNAGVVNVFSITFLVLDEADRMLDMGFEPQIMKILLDIRPDRQTIMTSATWPSGVRRLATRYMTDPMQIFVGSLDLAACHTVTQHIEIVDEEFKVQRLMDFLNNERDPKEKCLVFVGRKSTCDYLSAEFALKGIDCDSIHGGREQVDRESALANFKNGDTMILIATDVASRGLDICDISYVFNLDMPKDMEEYVHRVGRTGRAGRSGTSITLVTRRDWSNAAHLIEILAEANQYVPDELVEMADRFKIRQERDEREGRRGGRRGGRGRSRYDREDRGDRGDSWVPCA